MWLRRTGVPAPAVTEAPVAWRVVAGDSLTAADLYAALRLRSQVFVVEQECAYQDVDGADLWPGTLHVLAERDGALVAYARILESAPGVAHSAPTSGLRIGRVLVASEARGTGLARAVMEQALAECARRPELGVELSAQAHLVGFYGGLGFVATGDEYDEDGIPHVDMRLTT